MLQESLVAVKMFVVSLFVDELWSSKPSALERLRSRVHLDVPFSPLFHLEQLLNHLDDRLHLLGWVLLHLVKQCPHASAVVSD